MKMLHFIPTFDVFTNVDGVPDSTYFRQDMLHLNRIGYIRWAERIKATLLEDEINP